MPARVVEGEALPGCVSVQLGERLLAPVVMAVPLGGLEEREDGLEETLALGVALGERDALGLRVPALIVGRREREGEEHPLREAMLQGEAVGGQRWRCTVV